jgi:hypothetical protein
MERQKPDVERVLNASPMIVTDYPIIQANRTTVKGYSYTHGMKVLFDPTWLEK